MWELLSHEDHVDIGGSGEREPLHCMSGAGHDILCPWYINSVGGAAPASCFLLDIVAICFLTMLSGRTAPRMSQDGQIYFMNAPVLG